MESGKELNINAFDNHPDATAFNRAVRDEKGDIVDYIIVAVNRSFLRLTGLKREEVIGLRASELRSFEARDGFSWARWYAAAAFSREGKSAEWHAEQASRWFLVDFHRVDDDYACTFFRDISGLKQAESKLKESEQRFREVVANVPGAVYQFVQRPGGETETVFMSEGAREIFGRDPQLLVTDENLFGDLHPDDLPGFIASIGESARDLSPWNLDFRLVSGEQKVKWIRGAASPRLLPDGSICWTGLLIDFTGSKKVEEQLRIKDQAMAAALNAMAMFDFNGQLTYVNPALLGLWGFDHEDEVIGASIDDLWEDRAASREMMDWLLREGRWKGELVACKRDGQFMVLHLNAAKVYAHDGKPLQLMASFEDFTERIKTEEDLVRAKIVAEKASKAKSRFLANVSHEIRTPMNVIVGITELLGQSTLSREQKEYTGMVRESAAALLVLIDDILDLSKIEAERLEINCHDFDLPGEMAKVLNAQRFLAANKGLHFQYEFGDNLPLIVKGDLGRINQVLKNLVANAIKFTSEGSVSIIIALDDDLPPGSARKKNPSGRDPVFVRFTVRDTGIGIAPEYHESIFHSFAQIDFSPTMHHEGTGLGLAISKSLVELMGGKIWIKSRVGEGSTFTFSLPLVVRPGEKTPDRPSGREASSQATEERNLEVLLAEDKPMNQRLARAILENMGHRVTIAANGNEALTLAKANRYDAILMDVNMPEMDGLDATRAIRAWEKEQKAATTTIIAMTAYAMTGDKDRCLKAGMDAYLSKPLDITKLKMTLQAVPGN